MPITHVVFDMAGTTVRDDGHAVSKCLVEALAEHDVIVTLDQARATMGKPKPVALRELAEEMTNTPQTDAQVDALFESFRTRMIDHYTHSEGVGAMPGAEQVFADLKAMGCKVTLDTGFSKQVVEAILKRLGWTVGETIDAYVASDEVENGRPAADLIHEAMRRVGTESTANVCKVGDAAADLGEGHSAGCPLNIGVCSGAFTDAQLKAHPHTHIVPDITAVPQIVRAFNMG